jgi:hypothetical protein
MEYTRRVMTNVVKPGPVGGMNDAPMGQFALVRSYPTPDFRAVTSPNADTRAAEDRGLAAGRHQGG